MGWIERVGTALSVVVAAAAVAAASAATAASAASSAAAAGGGAAVTATVDRQTSDIRAGRKNEEYFLDLLFIGASQALQERRHSTRYSSSSCAVEPYLLITSAHHRCHLRNFVLPVLPTRVTCLVQVHT